MTNDPVGQLVTLQAIRRIGEKVLARGVSRETQIALCSSIARLDWEIAALVDSIGKG